MKALFTILVMLTSISAGNGIDQQPNPNEAAKFPSLNDLGLIINSDSKVVVGGCECHSPFANANLMGGDRIVSVNGSKVDSIESLKKALSKARPKRSIEFIIVPILRFGSQDLEKKIMIEFPANWWDRGNK